MGIITPKSDEAGATTGWLMRSDMCGFAFVRLLVFRQLWDVLV